MLTINIQISLAVILLHRKRRHIKAHATITGDNSRTRNRGSLIHSNYSLHESRIGVCGLLAFIQSMNFLSNSLMNSTH